jgi:hypothetical protein
MITRPYKCGHGTEEIVEFLDGILEEKLCEKCQKTYDSETRAMILIARIGAPATYRIISTMNLDLINAALGLCRDINYVRDLGDVWRMMQYTYKRLLPEEQDRFYNEAEEYLDAVCK